MLDKQGILWVNSQSPARRGLTISVALHKMYPNDDLPFFPCVLQLLLFCYLMVLWVDFLEDCHRNCVASMISSFEPMSHLFPGRNNLFSYYLYLFLSGVFFSSQFLVRSAADRVPDCRIFKYTLYKYMQLNQKWE